MTRREREEWGRFLALWLANGGTQDEAAEITDCAKALSRINEADCSYEDTTGRRAKREARLTKRVVDLCKAHGWKPKFGGDPRGLAVKVRGLKRADGSAAWDTWGGESDGYGVPEV